MADGRLAQQLDRARRQREQRRLDLDQVRQDCRRRLRDGDLGAGQQWRVQIEDPRSRSGKRQHGQVAVTGGQLERFHRGGGDRGDGRLVELRGTRIGFGPAAEHHD